MSAPTKQKTWVAGDSVAAADLNANFDNAFGGMTDGTKDLTVSTVTAAAFTGNCTATTANITSIAGVTSADATSANTLANAVTRSSNVTVGVLGVAVSNAIASFTTNSTSYVDVTNLTVTITTAGRPVKLELISDGTSPGYLSASTASAGLLVESFFAFVRASTTLSETVLYDLYNNSQTHSLAVPLGAFSHVDVVGAGTYTYKVQTKAYSGCNASVYDCKLVAYEL